jgi:predicted enzyme related to lactoylglutathione lyase
MRRNAGLVENLWQLTAAGCSYLLLCSCGAKEPASIDGETSTSPSANTTAPATETGGGTKAAPSAAGSSSAQPSRPAQAGSSAGAVASGAAAGTSAAGTVASSTAGAGAPAEPAAGSGGAGAPASGAGCPEAKGSTTDARLHMHHIHFNTQDPDASVAFVQKFFNATPFDYCKDAAGVATRAAKTDRAYFLYSKVSAPPLNMRLNRLAHVGYIESDVAGELKRLLDLDVPLADSTVCATAAMGTPCNTGPVQWFYVDMPESARFEIATGPGPATSGFGHIHLVAPDYSFFQKVLGDALQDPNGNAHVDQVNMVASGRTGVLDNTITYEDTRGAAIDHVGFSTGDLEGTLKRIEEAGVKIEEPISLKPEYGFRSFMVRSAEGIWLEILEGDGFKP